jgi:DNA-binding NarL/FixJ family response regulator
MNFEISPNLRPQPPLRVFVADDHPVVLNGITALVTADPGLEIVGQAMDGPTALAQAIYLRPDVAVLDLSMPGLHGVEVAQQLLAAYPPCRILVLTVHEDMAYLQRLLDIGVAGYVLKRSATDELSRGIYAVAEGGTYIDCSICRDAIEPALAPKPKTDEEHRVIDLSEREQHVLRLTAQGHSNKTIAGKLKIAVKTVDTYKARAMAKLGFRNRVDVVRYAVSEGWLNETHQ